MKTPPWKLIVPSICFELCQYKKSETDPVLYRDYYYVLFGSFTDHTFILTDVPKDGDKQLHGCKSCVTVLDGYILLLDDTVHNVMKRTDIVNLFGIIKKCFN